VLHVERDASGRRRVSTLGEFVLDRRGRLAIGRASGDVR